MARWAIIIGINHYEHLAQDKHLKYAVQDAEAVKAFLCERAGFPSNNILLCSDHSQPVGSLSTRPTRTNLRRILKEELLQAARADSFWFFFAGHGISKNYQDYLLPCDGNPYDEESAISVRFIVDCLRQCNAQNIVLVLDMCREGRPQLTGSRGTTKIGQETIRITQQQGIITIFSCGPCQESYEIDELRQGAFTHVFLEGLQQYQILRQLVEYLTHEVPAVNHRYNKPIQRPYIICEPVQKYDLPLLTELLPERGSCNANNEELQRIIQTLDQDLQDLKQIADDAKMASNITDVRKRFLEWKQRTVNFISKEVGQEEALKLRMISARKDFKNDKARLLNEATQSRIYLIALSQNLSSKEN
jgi:uncharacterized caspase-like protein